MVKKSVEINPSLMPPPKPLKLFQEYLQLSFSNQKVPKLIVNCGELIHRNMSVQLSY